MTTIQTQRSTLVYASHFYPGIHIAQDLLELGHYHATPA